MWFDFVQNAQNKKRNFGKNKETNKKVKKTRLKTRTADD